MTSTQIVLGQLTTTQCVAAAGLSYLAYILVPYLLDPLDYRRRFSGPWMASLTNIWLARAVLTGRRSEMIHELHQKYGKFVRIGPNHISISDPAALQARIRAVYAHGSGLLKSDFYQAFVVSQTDVFNEQAKAAHMMKRKRIANIYSLQNVLAFEPRVQRYIHQLCGQLDMRCAAAVQGSSGVNWGVKDGRALLDISHQLSYLAFDIISDLALGAPFGMVEAQEDDAPVLQAIASSLDNSAKGTKISVVKTMDESAKFITFSGFLPAWSRPFLFLLPWQMKGARGVMKFRGVAIAALNSRIHNGRQMDADADGQISDKPPVDLVDKLMEARDDNGQPLSKDEIISEAVITLGAGSDTSSNSLSAICFFLAKNPRTQLLLQAELDAHIPVVCDDEDELASDIVTPFDKVKNLPYLNACIKEAMRLHATVGGGLPRVVPPGKTLILDGHTFKAGSVISVPTYTTNRSKMWGDDAEDFRPERWLEENNLATKYFAPFSLGSRACVGRNLADINIIMTTATLFRRYNILLADPEDTLHSHEHFVRDAHACDVVIKRRNDKD